MPYFQGGNIVMTTTNGTTNNMVDQLRPFLQRLDYLRSRWADEREYEDFEEYRQAAAAALPAGAVLARLDKRFNATVEWKDRVFEIKTTARDISLFEVSKA